MTDHDGDGGTSVADERAAAAARAAHERALVSWRRYAAVMAALAVALGGFVFRVVQTSEVRAVSIQTSSVSPSPVPAGVLAAAPNLVWASGNQVVQGQALFDDVLATSATRSVAGLDVRTGAVRWRYSRSDRLLCSASSDGSVVMAIYAHDGLCDEISALDSGSGRRLWTRTLIGTANRAELALSAIPGFLLIAMPDSVELLSPTSGLDYWFYPQPAGCVTGTADLGSGIAAEIVRKGADGKTVHADVQGQVVVTARCAGRETLSLLAGSLPPAAKSNPLVWTTSRQGQSPLAVDGAINVLVADGRSVHALNPAGGAVAAHIALPAVVQPAPRPQSFTALGGSVVIARTGNGELGLRGTRWLWTVPGQLTPPTGQARLIAVRKSVVGVFDAATGRVRTGRRIAGIDPSASVFQVGTRIIAAAGTTAAYQ